MEAGQITRRVLPHRRRQPRSQGRGTCVDGVPVAGFRSSSMLACLFRADARGLREAAEAAHKPLAVRRIAFVPHALTPILWPSDFGPDHRALPRINPIQRNHNWLKSLSLIFSQTLRPPGPSAPKLSETMVFGSKPRHGRGVPDGQWRCENTQS